MKTGLTIEQEQEYNRDKEISQYLEKNQTKVDTYQLLKDAQTELDADLASFENLIGGKDVSTKSITDSKEGMKRDVALTYEFFCTQSWAFCQVTPARKALSSNFEWTEAKIFKLEDGAVKGFAQAINKIITDELLPLPAFASTTIDAPALAAALAKAEAFAGSIGFVGSLSTAKSEAATNIDNMIPVLRTDSELIAKLSVFFKRSDNGFYKGMQQALVINDIGVHHQYVEGDVKDADGNPVTNAVFTIVGTEKITKSNLLGHYKTPNMRKGLYTIKGEVPGKPAQEKVFQMKHDTVHLDWVF